MRWPATLTASSPTAQQPLSQRCSCSHKSPSGSSGFGQYCFEGFNTGRALGPMGPMSGGLQPLRLMGRGPGYDPFHCNMYYVCFSWHEWSPVPFACPDGEMFDKPERKHA
ncbi:hypothetical protein GWK47_018760 [Chionoecetes opilio]|uniref:Uncharacterized protein n=1 Tax=Chionoecetes opilio TaxID=41210 RepID=A0A8J4XT07_CHIOP|nr:hypothetical protein GWK47_018760 [Chionoecetes opilio]